jgi:hypothetical protein
MTIKSRFKVLQLENPLHIHDAGIPYAPCNLWPDFFMVPFVVGDQRWIVFEIQRKTESSVQAG